MYFEKLQRLKDTGVNEVVINQLDSWLASRRPAVCKYLNPIQFSVDCQVDEGMSLDAFEWSCVSEIAVLQRKIVVSCPICNSYVRTITNENDIGKEFHCDECEWEFIPKQNPESMVVYYSLANPLNNPSLWVDGEPGKVSGLRVDDIALLSKKSESARRLLLKMLDS